MNDGILIIDKPIEWTSHDVVGRLRKLLQTKRIGHTGTLDPFATGVIVALVGQATRLAQFLDKDQKEYEATIQFGFETDTGDLTGELKDEVGRMKDEEISEILNKTNWDKIFANFRGKIEQVPPMYSAKKIDGKKLYELARKGIEIERKAVKITIYSLEINKDQKPKAEDQICIRVVCSAGTYIRTLAEDIGRKIGVPCHLSALRRVCAGKFSIAQAVTLEQLTEIIAENKLAEKFISMNEAVSHLPKCVLTDAEIVKVKNGVGVAASFENESVQIVRMIDAAENLFAIGEFDIEQKVIKPRIVFPNF